MSSGFAVDEDWLRLIPTSVPYMALNFLDTFRVSTLAIAVSAAMAGCGGGGGTSGTDELATHSSTPSTSDTTQSAAVDSGNSVAVTSSTTSANDVADQDTATAKPIVAPATEIADPGTTVVALADVATSAEIQSVATSTLSAPKTAVAATPRSGVGLNLSGMSYYASEIATIDVMKRAGAWLTQCNGTSGCANFAIGAGTWDTKEQASLNLDADGYPRTLPAAADSTLKYRKVTTMLSVNGVLPAGRYTVLYDGAGTLTYGGNVMKQVSLSTAGRDVVDLAAGASTSFWLTITATTPGNYLHNIRVYLPGGACASDLQTFAADATACGGTKGAFVPFASFPAANIWHPQFLADVKGFRTLRYMDWAVTNGSQMANWSERPLVTNRSWAGSNGVPAEAMIDLANVTGSDPWLNVPVHASDDFVAQFARLVTQKLSSTLTVNLEYGNEAWNYAFAATQWMLAQGQAAWPDEVAKGTSIYALENNWYARRLVQTCTIAKTSSSTARARFRCVANTQAAVPYQTDQVLACSVAAKTLGQACAKSVDVVSIAPYFGYYLGAPTAAAAMLSWSASPTDGVDKVFQELTGRDSSGRLVVAPLTLIASPVSPAPSGALAQSAAWMVGTKAVATKYGLPMWAYEGGQHLVPPATDTTGAISAMMINANRDPRMQAAYEQMIANWQSAGGQVFAYFNHSAVPSKSGSWGMKESMGDNANAKWKAALEKRNSACWWAGC
jgi:hypothetical protein